MLAMRLRDDSDTDDHTADERIVPYDDPLAVPGARFPLRGNFPAQCLEAGLSLAQRLCPRVDDARKPRGGAVVVVFEKGTRRRHDRRAIS